MSPKLRAACEAIAADNGGVIPLRPHVLCDMVEMAERSAYLDGAVWVVEQVANGRLARDLLTELRAKLDAHRGGISTLEALVQAHKGNLRSGGREGK